jgi:hypothetical protein
MSDEPVRYQPPSKPIFGDWGDVTNFLGEVLKAVTPDSSSAQDPKSGRKAHPVNIPRILDLRHLSPYHATCVSSKVQSTIGLGFVTEEDKKRKKLKEEMSQAGRPVAPGGIQPPQKPKGVNKGSGDSNTSPVAKALDPLCRISFQDVLSAVVDEYYQVGNGYIEVVRSKADGPVVGLHYLPAASVYMVVMPDHTIYYEIVSVKEPGGSFSFAGGGKRVFAAFGKTKELQGLNDPNIQVYEGPKGQVSEVIHFRKASASSRWYGFPDWISGVPCVEISQKLRQYQHDFFDNRAVPEVIIAVTGGVLDDAVLKKIEAGLFRTMGSGQSHKSMVVNLPDNIALQVEKLAGDSSNDNAQSGLANSLAMEIVTAHRVPPLLAGIQVPGKMGASNELVSAIKGFQALVIGPEQQVIETTLKNTLGGAGISGLSAEDFDLCTITDEMEIEQLDTISRMGNEFASPQNQGRDPNQGLKD